MEWPLHRATCSFLVACRMIALYLVLWCCLFARTTAEGNTLLAMLIKKNWSCEMDMSDGLKPGGCTRCTRTLDVSLQANHHWPECTSAGRLQQRGTKVRCAGRASAARPSPPAATARCCRKPFFSSSKSCLSLSLADSPHTTRCTGSRDGHHVLCCLVLVFSVSASSVSV